MFSVEPSLLIAAAASFVMGVMGYVIARNWIRPIVRYNITKHKLDHDLKHYVSELEAAADVGKPPGPRTSEILKSARKHSMDLVSCHSSELPYWYQLLLTSRMESPAEASGLVTGLSKIKDPLQVADRIQDVRKKLGLK
ncbi:hypothetical protein LJC47_01625 [Desulfosarcina sp. OttesenSCG-928-B08]|nr:hypothetical protein [Desulfosarcina sp. OttesenSCG-928-B08]